MALHGLCFLTFGQVVFVPLVPLYLQQLFGLGLARSRLDVEGPVTPCAVWSRGFAAIAIRGVELRFLALTSQVAHCVELVLHPLRSLIMILDTDGFCKLLAPLKLRGRSRRHLCNFGSGLGACLSQVSGSAGLALRLGSLLSLLSCLGGQLLLRTTGKKRANAYSLAAALVIVELTHEGCLSRYKGHA